MPQSRHSAKSPRKPATPVFAIAPIERARGWWLYLWPFQSREALVTTFCLVGFSLWVLVGHLWAHLGALPLALIACVIGSMYFGPCHFLPARLIIATRREARGLVDEVDELIQWIGYTAEDSGRAGHLKYCRQGNNWLGRWFAWKELEVELRWSIDRLEIRGPVVLIEWLRYRLGRGLSG